MLQSSSASAGVDVIPLFLNHVSDQQIDDADLIIASPLVLEEEHSQAKPSVRIQHIPTGISVHSSGYFLLLSWARFNVIIIFRGPSKIFCFLFWSICKLVNISISFL